MTQTPTILEEIVVQKRKRLAEQCEAMSLQSLRKDIQPSQRDFKAALQNPCPAFITECKKASPSKGLIRPDFDLDLIAGVYGKHASAISVLTESDYFQGSLANLGIVRDKVSQPLLAKDFFVDPYQVYQARHFGADAILLILAILDDNTWRQLFDLARSLGMDAITEVSNLSEQQRAVALGAPIVGINNRNLRDMSVDLNMTSLLAEGLPEDVIVISESGFHEHRQVRKMSQIADGFLIGSSLMAESNLAAAVKKIIYGECKVCGLMRPRDAQIADDAGAVYGGVIFAESSPRKVAADQVSAIFGDTDLIRVGVFQDHSVQSIVDTVRRAQLQVVQLHGDEDQQLVVDLQKQLGDTVQVWKAISVSQYTQVAHVWLQTGVDRLVVDHHVGHKKGGTGIPFDWSRLPNEHRQHVIVAGGIGPDNVRSAIGLGCAGVDLNSKLETEPGVKSEKLIRQSFSEIRNYQA